MEANMKELLGREASSTTVVNNNLIFLNFGNEDMSHVQPPLQYLEKAFDGLRELLNDVYFNNNMPQNNTIRINIAKNTAEVRYSDGWKAVAVLEAASKMIGKCGFYMLSAYDSERHKENDKVMEFGFSLQNPGFGRTASITTDIHHKLLLRACESFIE